jgi:hypothetical protein
VSELAPWRVALDGPPASFVLDDEVFCVVGPWSSLLEHLQLVAWQMPLLYDLLDDASADYLDDRLDDPDDSLTLRELARVAEGLVEAATGRRWWVAQRLIASVVDEWQALDGLLLLRGVDLVALARNAPSRLCSVMYALITEHMNARDRELFDFKISRPPRGVDVRKKPIMTAEEQGAAFTSAMAGLQGGRV